MDLQHLELSNGQRIAYRPRSGSEPTILFLSGYASDMEGAKALAVDAFAAEHGVGMVRFDFSGTGGSSGRFEDATIEDWLNESLAVTDRLTSGPLVLVGSSMGGWLALLLALQRPQRVKAILGIAAAPDFTEWGFGREERERLARDGQISEPAPDDSRGRFFSHAFWASGQQRLLLDAEVSIDCPVRLIHGELDSIVPVSLAHRIMDRLRSADVQLTIVKGGGHRLSEPHEIRTILRTLADLVEPCP